MTSKLFLVFEHKRYPVDSMMDLQTMSTSSVRLCLKCDIFIVKINHILISITIYLDLLNSLDSFLGISFRFITKGYVIHILQIFDTYLYSIYHSTKSKFKTNKLCFVLRAIQMRLCVYNVQQYYICKCLSIWNRGSTGMSCSENWFFTRFKSLSFGVKYLSCVFGVIFL